VEVAWTSDQASQTGKLMRVPMPGRAFRPTRCPGARRRRFHGAAPAPSQRSAAQCRRAGRTLARACYDAVERVRYEALGSDGYAACGQSRCRDRPACGRRPDQPRHQARGSAAAHRAFAAAAREADRRAVPALARLGTDMVRSWIEAKAGDDMAGLADKLEDQKAFKACARCSAIST
jgi:cobaltochelatase CobT